MNELRADRSRWWPWLLSAIVYLVACRIMLAPIYNFQHLNSASYQGDARLMIWTLAWDNHATLDRVRPFFDANIFFPSPNALAYSEHLFGISLFSLPVYWLTRNPVLAYNVVWLLAYFLSALAAHALAWRDTRDHVASLFAGLAFAFCFFRMHHGHGHLHMVWAFWIPLSIAAMDRWIAEPTWRRTVVFVIVVTMQALASWYQAVLIFIADGVLLAWKVTAERCFSGPEGRRRARRFSVLALVGAAAALGCVWPFARHYGVLASAPPSEAAGSAADVAGFLIPPENTLAGQWLLSHGVKGPRWIWGEQTVYLGWIVLALAMICVGILVAAMRGGPSDRARTPDDLSEPADRPVIWAGYYVALGAIAVAFAFGPSTGEIAVNRWGWSPFGLLMSIPGVALFRAPARFSELVTLALAMLAAGACASLHRRWPRAGRIVTLVGIPLMLADFYVVKFPGGPPQPLPAPNVYRQLAMLPAGAVMSLPDYAGTPGWFIEPDYQYFSTAHWHPIANGYSRAEPPGFRERMGRFKAFPSAGSVAALHESGIHYVVVHAAAWPGGSAAASAAAHSPAVRLVARSGNDYLFELR